MADKQSNSPAGVVSNSFSKGMIKDFNDTFVGEGFYTHARNGVNNSHDGQVGVIGNEPSNIKCVQLPYDLIGAIHTVDDIWIVYTTNDVDSEIGLFDESQCKYTKIVNDPCLGFKRSHLITGVFRRRYDCERLAYWDDGLNPTRFMDIDNVPWKQNCTTINGCTTCINTTSLNCEALRIAPLIKHPCIKLKKGNIAGTLPNGSYQVCIAYTVNQVKVTDYIGLTEVQGLFTHDNTSSSLEVIIESIDKTFDEFELVVLSNINAQSVARQIGFYNTSQGKIYIDRWDTEYPVVSVGQVVFRSDAIEKTDSMYTVNNYLLRVGVYSKFKFNYQPLANKIITKWQAVQYPADYYIKGGNNTGYLRDEQYPFFIRWIYNTGDRSESYHIPGRAPLATDRTNITGADAFETLNGVPRERWQVQNTATVDTLLSNTLPDGGFIIAEGKMAYWESTELYPANRPDIWGNLCGLPIRHHKMPDETVNPILSSFNANGNNIVLLGVQFSNIAHPLDNNGNPIDSIIGYEILRGSREGNKSIIAKGMFNNMRGYSIPGNTTTQGLYQNYPYNDLSPDNYLTSDEQNGDNGRVNPDNLPDLSDYKKDIFSFHSPEVTFSNPYLNANEVKLYQEIYGSSQGNFEVPYKHPKFKAPSDAVDFTVKILASFITTSDVITLAAGGDFDITLAADNDIPLTTSIIKPHRQDAISGVFVGPAGAGTTGTTGVPLTDTEESIVRTIGNKTISYWNLITYGLIGVLTTSVRYEQLFKIIIALIPKRQYASQYNSHGFYNKSIPNVLGNIRREIKAANYIGSSISQFTGSYQVNNINRSKFVIIQIGQNINNPSKVDNSRFIISKQPAVTTISSYYGSIKISIPSQYGQLDSIKQLVISDCIFPTTPTVAFRTLTSTIFGGDIYINRFTEKNTMFFFNDWLMGQPDLTEYDYSLYQNIPYVRYWMNTNSIAGGLFNLASKRRSLDNRVPKTFYVEGYFYLFNSGVRDFFVESEINLAYRDWDIDSAKRHYDPYNYANLTALFRSDIIQSGNYYKYDYSLSISKLVNSSISWGNLLPRDYDPLVAASCYTYKPNTVIYSLPQQEEAKKDNWRLFLTNNYKNFSSPVTGIKQVNKTGALFMMKWQSPLQFMGIEELKLDGTGAKITIGDAGLFTGPQQLQAIVNADASYEYGSNQGKYCSINTKYGIFWVSQNQGKVFNYIGQLDEISNNGLKWWMAKYLPSELLKVYPDYPLYDNPLKGIGVQMVYDNTNEIVYITKKDYKPLRSDLLYDDGGFYYVTGYTTQTICPTGYTLVNGVCTKTETIPALSSGTTFQLTRTPFKDYGKNGTRVYNSASTTGTYTLLNVSNPFWISNPSAPNTQAGQLNNGPVNRLAQWGMINSVVVNNYTGGQVPPVGQWIGFDICLNILETKTYYVAIAADNQYRLSLNGNQILISDPLYPVSTFNYLHIYPITISAGNHILKLEGYNSGNEACFAAEIYDLSNKPSNVSVVDFLNIQTSYDNLNRIFTTANQTSFTSQTYSCPIGYGLSNPSCNQPICSRTVTAPPTIITIPNKVYCNFDSECWENASWTISYDPKSKSWVSFHDWIPSFLLPGKNHFMTVNNNSIWKHNITCTSYCNYYGVNYPFEVEFVSGTGQTVTSMRSIEYLLEVYRYHNDCRDKFHVLDENFDQAMVYNSEQISGLLYLSLKAKNNPLDLLTYPKITNSGITINFSKEENKYRFNQFWDVTKNRGEYTTGFSIPMFNTEANGYKYVANPNYINYSKDPLQRKKFRHNVNRVWMRKGVSGNNKFLFKLSNQKILQSPR